HEDRHRGFEPRRVVERTGIDRVAGDLADDAAIDEASAGRAVIAVGDAAVAEPVRMCQHRTRDRDGARGKSHEPDVTGARATAAIGAVAIAGIGRLALRFVAHLAAETASGDRLTHVNSLAQ